MATAAYAPLYLRLILYVIRGLRPPAAWTVMAMTIVIAAAVPLTGVVAAVVLRCRCLLLIVPIVITSPEARTVSASENDQCPGAWKRYCDAAELLNLRSRPDS